MKDIDIILDKLEPKKREEYRRAMEKYEDNHWWESGNPVEIAMYQIFEHAMLVDPLTFRIGLGMLFGRYIGDFELKVNLNRIREEAKYAIGKLKTEINTDLGSWNDAEYRERARRNLRKFEDYCERTGQKLIEFESETEPDKGPEPSEMKSELWWFD